jgi:hypothetical protein
MTKPQLPRARVPKPTRVHFNRKPKKLARAKKQDDLDDIKHAKLMKGH